MKSRYLLRLASALAFSFPALITAGRAYAHESAKDANLQYRKAFEALGQKNWPEARRLLLALWSQAHTWDVAAGLGQAEFLLENHAAGATYTAFALANVPPSENPKTVERLRAALDEMKEAVGTVRIAVNKYGAEIVAEHEVVGTSPLSREVYLNPGTRLLEARLDGGYGKQPLEVQAGKSYQIALSVDEPLGEAGTASTPKISSSVAPRELPSPGAHDRASSTWTPVLITGGLAVAAAAIGAGFALDARSAKSDGEKALSDAEATFGSNPCTPSKGGGSELCQNVSELQDQRKSSNTVAAAAFVASGVFAVTAIGSYFLWTKPSSTRLDAWLVPGSSGIRLSGSF
jgi:hypothetical protein